MRRTANPRTCGGRPPARLSGINTSGGAAPGVGGGGGRSGGCAWGGGGERGRVRWLSRNPPREDACDVVRSAVFVGAFDQAAGGRSEIGRAVHDAEDLLVAHGSGEPVRAEQD